MGSLANSTPLARRITEVLKDVSPEDLVNGLRNVLIVVGLLCFIGICRWAYGKHAKAGFDEAAQLPLTDDDLPVCPADRKE